MKLSQVFATDAKADNLGYRVSRRFYSNEEGHGPRYSQVVWALLVLKNYVRRQRGEQVAPDPTESYFCQGIPIYRGPREPKKPTPPTQPQSPPVSHPRHPEPSPKAARSRRRVRAMR